MKISSVRKMAESLARAALGDSVTEKDVQGTEALIIECKGLSVNQ